MGEIIKRLASKIIKGEHEIEIELNRDPTGSAYNHVHIQGSDFRMEFMEKDFVEHATTIINAAHNLKKIKELES